MKILTSTIAAAAILMIAQSPAQAKNNKHDNHNGNNHNSHQGSYGNGCPPGLAKKHNGCQPPGQAKKARWGRGQYLPRTYRTYYVPRAYRDRYRDTSAYSYRYYDGFVYRIDSKTFIIQQVISAILR